MARQASSEPTRLLNPLSSLPKGKTSLPETPQTTIWDNRDLPLRYRKYGLDRFPPEAWRAVGAFLASDAWSLYLWGETGSHKTTLAVAVLVELRRRAGYAICRGLFVPAYSAVGTLRRPNDPNAQAVIMKWEAEQWLVLDDLGKHRDTPHVVEQLLFLLHRRYDWWTPESKQRTIITSNLPLQKIAGIIDPATSRRLQEGTVLHLTTDKPQGPPEAP